MSLSSELIDQLVKVTQNTEPRDKDNTAYGTVVIMGSKKYVKIDGSDLMTPVSSTVAVENGDRVIVTIKSHSATVTGNTSSPAASDKKVTELGTKISDFEIVIADKVSAKELDVQIGRIDDLTADNATIKESLTANKASIDDLTAKNAEITGTLEANKAKIDDLDAKKLDTEVADIKYASVDRLDATDADLRNLKSDYAQFEKTTTGELQATNAKIDGLDTKYANVDFSNIGKAAIEQFYATSGIIKDLVVGDQTITGELVGITISGDLIKGNTIVADKLVIKGSDGLYYKLNTDGVTTEKEQTEYNSLNGQVIRAKSITATKIDVKDLVAFGATIGGFNIGQDSIFSGVKETVDNKSRGIYMDKNGQIAIGDVNNYIKYFKDTDGRYRLKISADSLEFNASGDSGEESKDLETVIKDINDKVDGIAKTNKGIGSITNYYLATSESSGVTTETAGWTTKIQNVSSSKKYLWNYEVTKYTDDTIANTTEPCIIGMYSAVGATGNGIQKITEYYALSALKDSVPTIWSENVPNLTATNKYMWNYEEILYTNGGTELTKKRIIGVYGDTGKDGAKGEKGEKGETGNNGKSIGSVVNYYLATSASSGVSTSTSGWTTTVQNVTLEKKYLWNYEVVKYSDGTVASTTSPCIIGTYGDTGKTGATGKNALQVLKQWNGTYTTIGQEVNCPTDRFNRTPVAGDMFTNVDASSNLGTWQITNVADGYAYFKMVSYVSAKGATGATGNGIKSIKEHYAVSTSNTVTPTSWLDDVPVTNPVNKYLWNYETITYTNGTSVDSKKRVIGVYGDTGKDGAKGEKGDDFRWNLVKGTNVASTAGWSTNGWGGSFDTLSKDDRTYKLVARDGWYVARYVNLKEYVGKELTISFYAKNVSAETTATSDYSLYVSNETGGNPYFSAQFKPNEAKPKQDVWEYYSYTIKTVNSDGQLGIGSACRPEGNGLKSTWLIKDLKIELGSPATPWSPHPDDLIGETGSSMLVLQTAYSYYQTELDTYATAGYNGTWTIATSTGVKTGDTVYLKVKNATKNGDSYIIARVNSIPSGTSVNCTSIGLLDKGDIGATGADGKGIKSTEVTYQASTSGTLIPTGTWQTSIPTVSAGQYLWTRTVITYTDDSKSTSYSVGRMGTNGTNGSAGRGIKSTAITYQAGSSGTTAPTGTWQTTVPATSASSPYLWTRTIITYTDDTTSTSYAVGSTLEGVSVGGRNLARKTSNEYCAAFNSFNGGDNICPSLAHVYLKGLSVGDKVTVRLVYKYTNIVAVTGKTAAAWIQGSGNITEWTSGAFCNSTSIVLSGSGEKIIKYSFVITSDMIKNQYWHVNIRHDGIQSGSVQWKEFKVEKGNIATDWTPAPEDGIASVDVEYYLSTSATALSGGSWSTTAPTWVNGKYMWSRTVTTDGAGNKTYSPNQNGVCIAGAKGETGATGATGVAGKGVSSIIEQYYKSTSATALSGGSWGTTYPGWENGKYIWTRSVITYTDNTSSTTTAVCVTGTKGSTGAPGKDANQVVHSVVGNGNTNKYIEFATVKVIQSYANYATTFKISGREYETTDVQFSFVSVNNTDPGLYFLRATGGFNVWMYKKTTSTWGLVTKLNEAWGYMRVYNFQPGSACISLTWTDTRYASLPSGCIAADQLQAAKTATNFMEFTSGAGLQIGDKTNGSWKGFRSRITSTAFEILNEAGTAVASYGRKLIQLGKDTTDAVIELCGGRGKISFTNRQSSTSWSSDKDLDDLTLTSESIRLDSHDIALNTTNEGILESIAEDKTAHAYTRLWSSIDNQSVRPDAGFSVTVDSYYNQIISRFQMESEAFAKTTGITLQSAYADGRGKSGKVEITPDAIQMSASSSKNCTFKVTQDGAYINNVAIPTDMNDRIVAQGTSGIWRYRKFASGVAECWGNIQHTTMTNVHEAQCYQWVGFPFTFKSISTITCGSWSPAVIANYGSVYVCTRNVQMGGCQIGASAKSGLGGLYASIHVMGTWK